ncbi:TIGR03758 family integrating conjugative element protein [Serratia microhaemolytica]|uniref:TIGR03758 family integrating conjugative element protein n=1 Tax=Serratia microhaemolytica TaxID=2675110 RepID=UPI000FDCF3D0|nr:TIGR03758 family integrating conjugative element protein [Serratia microhaemolytica]
MAMTQEQSDAFLSASGELAIDVLHLTCIGLLLALLFLWSAWALADVWLGWSNEKVRHAALGRFAIRAVILLVITIWMFAS